MLLIKLIGFDLDDCLFDSTGLSESARIKGIDAMLDQGLRIEKNKAIAILMEIVEEYGSNFSHHYDYFIRRLNQTDENVKLSFNTQYKLIASAVMAYHKEKIDSIELYDDVKETLIELRDRKIKTAVITDGIPIKQYEKIIRLKIDKLIDLVVISDEVGIRKPNPELFNYFLKKFKVKGEETIYIGDRIDKDIIPAKKNNIHSVYIHRGGKYDIYPSEKKFPKDFKPDYEIRSLKKIFDIIDELNMK
ncbi:MAG: TIGR02253 family HAD-type hydrolase [Candidatus Lokiarchaeota archaeon]|nr:TIGR02253 family HAD-type hydrolase [Candidatus Lokiarchaeota archaeon]MBD3198682.1 TIGR02253 family HAD-type hydrolase [Candidatus Lokiarchaeota archaeon]